MLKNNLVELRALEITDLETIYHWENNTKLWKVGDTLTPYAKYQIEKFIELSTEDIYTTKQLRLMIDYKDSQSIKTVGCIDLFDLDVKNEKAALGIMIEKAYRNRKIATNALSLFIEYCFKHLHLHQVYCHIPASNQASIKLFSQVGFEKNGELKDWIKTSNKYEKVFVFQLVNE